MNYSFDKLQILQQTTGNGRNTAWGIRKCTSNTHQTTPEPICEQEHQFLAAFFIRAIITHMN